MKKVLLFFYTLVFFGCGNSGDGITLSNPFLVKSYNAYTDDGFKYAWHLKPIDSGLVSHDISENSHANVFEAWAKSKGKGVKVAVIDYDFNPLNPDLYPNVVKTYDVENGSEYIRKDSNSHGTSVASIIAAPVNDYGIIGVAPEAQLILIDAKLTEDWQKVEAFKKAKEFGADVICCSWEFVNNVSDELKQAIKDDYDSGITVVFASGNNGLDLGFLDDSSDNEAELPWVIGVGATTELNTKADYSNYGEEIDILAPAGSTSFGLYTDDYYENNFKNLNFTGTSAAAPVVAGVVALIKSANPNLNPDQIYEIIASTADKIEPDIANYDSNGFSHTHGYGKINAAAAVSKALIY